MDILTSVALLFGKLSLLAVGGVNSTIPEIARQVVTVRHWLTPEQFAQLFAIANAAPGPNVMISTVIGAQVAGISGGLVATLAMILPAGILTMTFTKIWEQYRDTRWRKMLQVALLPITVGLIFAAAGVLILQSDHGVLTTTITLAAAGLSWRTGTHPVWLLIGGLFLGLLLI